MLTNAPRLFRLFGIDIRVHVSWLVVFVLVTASLAGGYLPDTVPDLHGTSRWLLAGAAALLFFASVLAHELSHSLVARSRGIGVHSITLFIFGGVSSLTGDAPTAGTEFLVAVVGPLTSIALGLVALGLAQVAPDAGIGAVFGYLGLVNLLVGGFNLIPGYPLDGGRVLRSIVWRVTRRMILATRVAAIVGQLVAYGFMLWGLFEVFGGNVFNGIWIAAIGWFLLSAASSSVREVVVERAMEGLRVADVFRPGPVTVHPAEPVESVVQRVMLPLNLDAVPVSDGRLLGVVTLRGVERVPRERRSSTAVGYAMERLDVLPTIDPSEPIRRALERLTSAGVAELAVVQDGRFLGLLTRVEVVRAIELRERLASTA